jgi:hypothetical protein
VLGGVYLFAWGVALRRATLYASTHPQNPDAARYGPYRYTGARPRRLLAALVTWHKSTACSFHGPNSQLRVAPQQSA